LKLPARIIFRVKNKILGTLEKVLGMMLTRLSSPALSGIPLPVGEANAKKGSKKN
jgi:hypothetical protein